MMRVAYVIGCFPLRSETFVYREVMGLRERGLEVDVFSVSRPTPDQAGAALEATRGLRIEYISRVEAALALSRAVPRRVSELNQRLQREATLSSNAWLRLGRAQAIATRLRRRSYHRIHSHWPYGHQLASLVQLLTELPASISVHAHEVAHDSGHFATVFEQIDFAAFCNDAARRYLLARLPTADTGKCHLVYHGVDLAEFPVLGAPPRSPRLRLVSAGRLTATKGFTRLLRAVAALVEGGVQVELSIVGEGSQRETLTALAAELKIAERVRLTGWLGRDALREVFANSDVFCLLPDTNYHDGLPNVVLEAQALGRPVVISNLPAAAEAVTHGVDGFIVEPGDTKATCELLARLAREPELRLRLATAARQRVERQHDAHQHLAHLHQLLLSKSGLVS